MDKSTNQPKETPKSTESTDAPKASFWNRILQGKRKAKREQQKRKAKQTAIRSTYRTK
jgi:hypothetical protein